MMMAFSYFLFLPQASAKHSRAFSTAHSDNYGTAGDLWIEGGANAYEVLGVSPTCSEEIIRSAFRELAKATHPDMQTGTPHLSSSARFIVVLAAYQILSNPEKRARYDAYLQGSSKIQEKSHHGGTKTNASYGQGLASQEMEVAEWLRWYRRMVVAMVNQHEIGAGQGLQEHLRGNLQAALKAAYFGQYLDDTDAIPHCFEAEERAETGVLDILHLVSGRNLFGAVRQVSGIELLREGGPKCVPLVAHSGTRSYSQRSSTPDLMNDLMDTDASLVDKATAFLDSGKQLETELRCSEDVDLRAFVDLELYLFGNLVARATRAPPESINRSVSQIDRLDEIAIYLCSDQLRRNQNFAKTAELNKDFQGVLLGTIHGLSTTDFGGKSKVYSPDGKQTHIIWQHRTPLVKHMHWFKVDDKSALCECKSTRARLPSSKFWLFEPRCDKHNVGGWYIETLGRNDSVRSASLHRRWRNSMNNSSTNFSEKGYPTSTDWAGKTLGLLHPAMYIIAAAYKTLDAEAAKRRKKSLMSVIKEQPTLHAAASSALRWCRGKMSFVKSL